MKVTSWRKPFRVAVIFWLLTGVVAAIQAFVETQDPRIRTLLLVVLIVIGLLVLDLLSNMTFQSRRASRYCRDCVSNAEVRRAQRPEEPGPHKVALEKEKREA